jgi:hypothetical protein
LIKQSSCSLKLITTEELRMAAKFLWRHQRLNVEETFPEGNSEKDTM